MEALQGAIEEELNVAYAYHEMTSEHALAMMDWLQGRAAVTAASAAAVPPAAGAPVLVGGVCIASTTCAA
ncbi:hypothetical protein CLOP_g8056 [Closterium sp. NIES-67]|nr:hypothetical protein CLOP_g8056 [Closterium sp. NIES-67]